MQMSEPEGNPDIEEASQELQPLQDGSKWERWYAYGYFTMLLLAIVGAISGATWLGLLDLQVGFTFEANLGWVIEYLAGFLLLMFALWTFVQFVRVTGIGFVQGLAGAAARIAHNYEMPGEPTGEDQESGSESES